MSDYRMPIIRSAIACNLDANLLLASLPLLESERVQGIEWSFDTLYKHDAIPDWFIELLKAFGSEGRLVGHGVFFSLFSGRWTSDQQEWLMQLRRLSQDFQFDHVTEHFGFMTGEDFHKGAPINIPFTSSTLSIGRDRLSRIQDACRCPVGLENLAFAYSLDEVKRHGDFLNQLIEPVNGFIILDLHNLYCQLQNFTVDYTELIALYPLDRVREIHVSGGSWSRSLSNPTKQIRRDTHDDQVPVDVFDLLERTMPKCPNLKYVVLEQLGTALHLEEERRMFQQDFLTMERLVDRRNQHSAENQTRSFLPVDPPSIRPIPLEDSMLYKQQVELSTILETAPDYEEAENRLAASSLAKSAWNVEGWDPYMLETALAIAQKWKNGFE